MRAFGNLKLQIIDWLRFIVSTAERAFTCLEVELMKHKPKQLTPEEAVEFIDREDNPRLTEHRFNFASGAWVMTLWPNGQWTFVSKSKAKVSP